MVVSRVSLSRKDPSATDDKKECCDAIVKVEHMVQQARLQFPYTGGQSIIRYSVPLLYAGFKGRSYRRPI